MNRLGLLPVMIVASAASCFAQSSVGPLRTTSDQAQQQFERKRPKATGPDPVHAEFPGGEAAMHRFLLESFRYPDAEVVAGHVGKIYVEFVIEEDGTVGEVKVKHGVHPLLDREVVRVVRAMPRWKPEQLNGAAVRKKMIVPITVRVK